MILQQRTRLPLRCCCVHTHCATCPQGSLVQSLPGAQHGPGQRCSNWAPRNSTSIIGELGKNANSLPILRSSRLRTIVLGKAECCALCQFLFRCPGRRALLNKAHVEQSGASQVPARSDALAGPPSYPGIRPEIGPQSASLEAQSCKQSSYWCSNLTCLLQCEQVSPTAAHSSQNKAKPVAS